MKILALILAVLAIALGLAWATERAARVGEAIVTAGGYQ